MWVKSFIYRRSIFQGTLDTPSYLLLLLYILNNISSADKGWANEKLQKIEILAYGKNTVSSHFFNFDYRLFFLVYQSFDILLILIVGTHAMHSVLE